MKKILSTIVTTMILSTGAFSADFINGKFYGGVGMGMEDFSRYSSYDPGVALIINGGKPIIKLGPGTIGAEGEFTYTVVPLSTDRYRYDSDLTIMTLGAYATYTYDFDQKLYARAKAGIVARNHTFDSGTHYSYSDYNRVGEAIGLGAGYKFSNRMRVFSDIITLGGNNLTQVNFGVQMNF